MLGLLGTIFVLGTGILIHEIGHFVAARRFGILCHEFAIGMGPALYKKKVGETVYSLRLIPVGGYVLMAGEETEIDMLKKGQEISLSQNASGLVDRIYLTPRTGETTGTVTSVDVYENLALSLDVADGNPQVFAIDPKAQYIHKDDTEQQVAPRDRCLESKSKTARMIVLAAGAIMNFILAFVFVFIVGLFQGEPVMNGGLAEVVPDAPAYLAGLRTGDIIIQYGDTSVEVGTDLIELIRSNEGPVEVTFSRDDVEHTVLLEPELDQGFARIGVRPDVDTHFSLGYAWQWSVAQYRHFFGQMLMTFEMLFVTREAGIGDLSGPVGIYSITAEVITHGIFPLLLLAGLINVNLGLLNLMPFPALDGGRIIFILVELIARKPVPRKFEGYVHMAGFLLFAGLMVFVLFNDISRMIGY